jgi:hypothetical protein
MTVVVAYSGGLYGTYVEWCLTSLTSDTPIAAPFTSVGNSHKFKGVHVRHVDGWNHYINNNVHHPFVRLHPKTKREESLDSNLTFLCDTAKSVIHLYPDRNSIVFCVNNYTTKTHPDWWGMQLDENHNELQSIYHNWPLDQRTETRQIPIWIRREFLSFYLMPAWFSQLEWYHPDRWQHPKTLVVTEKKLLFDFENTLLGIQQHCDLDFVRPISELVPYHEKNLTLQANIGQDELCANILDAVLSKTYFEWKHLPLASEAWIQWQLRNQGFEIQCHGLDMFPTNSVHLTKLLYSI